ncbi:MAG: DUF2203 domain-containing protein [Acidobacteria bacterium]|nr:DUF2203 domain-containing protein [Acidobacteriota bacterium]
MPRYFTLAQAERLLPKIERAMRRALELAELHQKAESGLQDTLRRLSMLGGAVADRRAISELKDRRDQAAAQVNDVISEIHGQGCQVKDLRLGLVDFPTLYRGDEVLLCWRFGEERIAYWHGLEEGFRGRKPLDQDFLDNHSGG